MASGSAKVSSVLSADVIGCERVRSPIARSSFGLGDASESSRGRLVVLRCRDSQNPPTKALKISALGGFCRFVGDASVEFFTR